MESFLVFLSDHTEELFVVDHSVLVGVCGLDHGLDLLSGEVLPDPLADLVELVNGEGLLSSGELGEEFLAGSLAWLLSSEPEHLQESGEVDGLSLGVLLDNLEDLQGLLLDACITRGVPKATMAFLSSRVVTSPL